MLLALGLVAIDRHLGEMLQQRWSQLFIVDAAGARSLLSTIAGAMATIAGVAFSMTMVALALASGQYTSRVMRNFMRDRGNQIVLGIFIGIFLYCLVVLGTISERPDPFVPACAVLGSILLSLLASGAFIFFIHHIASTIQAAEMAQAITQETLHMVEKYFPNAPGCNMERHMHSVLDIAAWHLVPARQWGTIQTVAENQLLEWACAHDAIVRMERKAGQFVDIGEALASVAMTKPLDEDMIAELNDAYGVDAFRTLDQDPSFGVRQLVDMALKALSPGINDSTTAVVCLNHIGVILAFCARRNLQARDRYDEHGKLRVLSIGIDFARLTRLAFRQIAESAEGNTEVSLRILGTIRKTGSACRRRTDCDALLHEVEIVGDIALRSAKSQHAKEQLGAELRALKDVLKRATLQPDNKRLASDETSRLPRH
jgi:uncharacterized membrane protein